MAGAKGTRGPFAMHPDFAVDALDLMGLGLGDVVTHIIDEPHTQVTRRDLECGEKRVLGQTHHHLAIDPGVVGRTGHGREILLPFRRRDGRAGELPVRYGDVILLHRLAHHLERVLAGLVSQPA